MTDNVVCRAVYDLPAGASVIDGLVQAIAIRSAGFTVVSNSALAPCELSSIPTSTRWLIFRIAEHILSLFMVSRSLVGSRLIELMACADLLCHLPTRNDNSCY